MKVTYNKQANAAYIYLTDQEPEPGRTTVEMPHREGLPWVVFDFKGGKLVGIEVLNASAGLFEDTLAEAEESECVTCS